jgi:glycosyltransferase involved in cell wall biosynthesis
MCPDKKNVMVVGQIPPPWHGQALAIKLLIESEFDGIDLQFVRMAFSRDIDDIGRFRWEKLFRLPLLIFRIWQVRFRKNCNILYYPPGGTTVTAVVRDIVVLLSCRILFKRVVFHSHAGGFVEVAEATPLPIRLLARFAYSKPDLLIQLTEKSPPDAVLTKSKRVVHVPYGLPDDGARYVARFRDSVTSGNTRLLFVGAVTLDKGVMVLLKACAHLKADGFDFSLRVMGRFSSPEFEVECKSFIQDHGLSGDVEFVGVVTGNDKWEIYCTSDIFCFPSFYKAENQPLVILEAMEFGLPIVASDWRGISTMIADGQTGYLLPIKDSAALAERIGFLIQRPELRTEMGRRAREVFLERYTDAIWRPAMESALREV